MAAFAVLERLPDKWRKKLSAGWSRLSLLVVIYNTMQDTSPHELIDVVKHRSIATNHMHIEIKIESCRRIKYQGKSEFNLGRIHVSKASLSVFSPAQTKSRPLITGEFLLRRDNRPPRLRPPRHPPTHTPPERDTRAASCQNPLKRLPRSEIPYVTKKRSPVADGSHVKNAGHIAPFGVGF